MSGSVSRFIDLHYRHFNAATLRDAAEAYLKDMQKQGRYQRDVY